MNAASMALALRLWCARLARWLAFIFPSVVDPSGRLNACIDEQARNAAVALLLKPIEGREREFFPFTDSAMILDDGGGSGILLFKDWEACHYFLIWLRRKRLESEIKQCPIVAGQYQGTCGVYSCPAWSKRHGGTCAMAPRRDTPCT